MQLKKLLFKTQITVSIILSRVFIRSDNSCCVATSKKSRVAGLGEDTIHPFVHKIIFSKISMQSRLNKRKLAVYFVKSKLVKMLAEFR